MSSQEEQSKALASTRLSRVSQHLKAARDLLVNGDFADSISDHRTYVIGNGSELWQTC